MVKSKESLHISHNPTEYIHFFLSSPVLNVRKLSFIVRYDDSPEQLLHFQLIDK